MSQLESAQLVVDDDGTIINRGGYLILDKPWPASASWHLGRQRALRRAVLVTWWPEVYFASTTAPQVFNHEWPHIWLPGRVDDVMNVRAPIPDRRG